MPPCSPLFPYTTLFRSAVGVLSEMLDDRRDSFFSLGGTRSENPVAEALGKIGSKEALDALARNLHKGGASAALGRFGDDRVGRSEEHTSELQSRGHLVCRPVLHSFPTRRSSDLPSVFFRRCSMTAVIRSSPSGVLGVKIQSRKLWARSEAKRPSMPSRGTCTKGALPPH